MILLCGIPSERPLARVAEALESCGARFLTFNQRAFDDTEILCADGEIDRAAMLRIGANSCPLSAITAAYARLMDDQRLPELRHEPEDSPRRQRCRQIHEELQRWLELSPLLVVNRFAPMASNSSKPYQAQLIRSAGFDVPETLVTNEPELALDFWRRHGRVVYKSSSCTRSIVRELDDGALRRVGDIGWCPVQFQAYVDGFDVRVHVVGREVFATRINSTRTDYRYSDPAGGPSPTLAPVELDGALSERCASLTSGLGLVLGGIDLRITPDGRAVCFEVNPNPAFDYYEGHTGQPIAAALALHLSQADR
jgi:glutathione synthase/RimK-type ligase-like ATP-grasp enzyme